MPTPDETFRQLDALIGIGMRLARSAPSGRVLLARIAKVLDPEWIPGPWRQEIGAELERAAKSASEPVEWRTIERSLRSAWGGEATDELDDINPEPVAVTPTSQVHKGQLDGREVAVKVSRPGLAASIRQDLALLEGLLVPLERAFPQLAAAEVVREFRERVMDELDLEHEAGWQRRFHRALREHPFLRVPSPYTSLAHENVLVSEWIEGTPLRSFADRDRAAARYVLFVLGAGRAGMVYADPDTDDVLVCPDGKLAILDFGASVAAKVPRLELISAAVEAFCERDVAEFGETLQRLGWLPASHGETALELIKQTLDQFAEPDSVLLDSAAVSAARDRLLARPEPLVELLVAGDLPAEDLWPARAAAQLFAVIARVGATAPWRELTRAALRDGWDAEEIQAP